MLYRFGPWILATIVSIHIQKLRCLRQLKLNQPCSTVSRPNLHFFWYHILKNIPGIIQRRIRQIHRGIVSQICVPSVWFSVLFWPFTVLTQCYMSCMFLSGIWNLEDDTVPYDSRHWMVNEYIEGCTHPDYVGECEHRNMREWTPCYSSVGRWPKEKSFDEA